MKSIRRFFPRSFNKYPKNFHRLHPDLGLVSVKGTDSTSMLQSIVTSDLSQFAKDEDRVAISTLILNNEGKIVTPLNIVRPVKYIGKTASVDDSIKLIQVPYSLMPQLTSILKQASFGLKVEIDDISEEYDQLSMFVCLSDSGGQQNRFRRRNLPRILQNNQRSRK